MSPAILLGPRLVGGWRSAHIRLGGNSCLREALVDRQGELVDRVAPDRARQARAWTDWTGRHSRKDEGKEIIAWTVERLFEETRRRPSESVRARPPDVIPNRTARGNGAGSKRVRSAEASTWPETLTRVIINGPSPSPALFPRRISFRSPRRGSRSAERDSVRLLERFVDEFSQRPRGLRAG